VLRAGGTGCAGKVVLVYAASGGGSGNIAPVFTSDPISKAGATEDVAYTGQTLAGSATDADGDTLSYSVQAGPAWLSIASNGALSGTPSNADVGANSWSVQVSDGNGGTDTAILNITVANVNDAPVFTVDPMSRADADVDAAYSGQTLAGSATDVDAGASLTYSKVSGPTWLSIAANGALSGTPSISDVGANSWTVRVSDGTATDTAVLNIAVVEVGPVLPDTADADLAVLGTVSGSYADTQAQDDSYESITEIYSGLISQIDHVWEFNLGAGNSLFKVDAYYVDSGDPDTGFIFSWGTSSAGPWTDMLTVTKTADNDTYQTYDMGSVPGTVYIRVVDNDRTKKASGLDTIRIDHMTIDAGSGGTENTAPSFNSDPIVEVNATENEAYSSSIADNASDPDSDPLTFSKVSGPTWLAVASNGSLSGTPAAGDVGLNSFTVKADDGNGGIATATLEITVIAAGGGGDPLPGAATDPSPASGARDIPTTAILSWTAGSDTVSHNVYIGTVLGSPTFIGNQTGTTFAPALLNKKTYYWRIDEVNAAGITTGTEWKFTTVR